MATVTIYAYNAGARLERGAKLGTVDEKHIMPSDVSKIVASYARILGYQVIAFRGGRPRDQFEANPRRRNPRGHSRSKRGRVDMSLVVDLLFAIDRDDVLARQHNAIVDDLTQRAREGRYNEAAAVAAWRRLATRVARKYAPDFGTITLDVQRELALDLEGRNRDRIMRAAGKS